MSILWCRRQPPTSDRTRPSLDRTARASRRFPAAGSSRAVAFSLHPRRPPGILHSRSGCPNFGGPAFAFPKYSPPRSSPPDTKREGGRAGSAAARHNCTAPCLLLSSPLPCDLVLDVGLDRSALPHPAPRSLPKPTKIYGAPACRRRGLRGGR